MTRLSRSTSHVLQSPSVQALVLSALRLGLHLPAPLERGEAAKSGHLEFER
jgi:hypothetical protein